MNQEWEKIGNDIKHIVEDAVNSQNFEKLNKNITNTFNDAVGSVQKGLLTAGKIANNAAEKQGKNLYSTFQNLSKQTLEKQKKIVKVDKQKDLFRKNTSVKAGGMALTICGCVLNTGLGFTVVILCLVSLFLGGAPMGIKIALSILLPFLVGSAVMTWKGSSMLSAVRRYRLYIEGLGGRTYCNIKELSTRSGKSISYVRKDVQKMIKKGWFRQGHLNQDSTCLIVSHETYQEYESLQRQKQEQEQQEQIKIQQKPDPVNVDKNHETLQRVMKEGQEYICKIRLCNQKITGKEITQKIAHMEVLVQKIFDRVQQDPDSLEDISKLMDYYLPTTIKLLEAYQQLCSQPVQGENIRSSKLEIEQTLDTLNDAFERLLDSLFEDVAWDISSDISVLQTMLAQEGLVGNEQWKM